MRLSELKGRAVVDITDSKKIGELSDILLDPATRKPTAIKVRTGLFSQALIVPMDQLKSVGPDAITVAGQASAAPPDSQPEAQSAPLPPLKEPIEATSIQGNKVLTDTGTLVGEVQDIIIDPATLEITGYEVRAGGLFTRSQEIDITPDVRHGDDLITVPSSLLS